MARPLKTGLDYFPLDTVLDMKVSYLEAEHSLTGFAIWIKLLQVIYQNESGEFDYSQVLRRRIHAKLWKIPEELLENIVKTCVEIGLFDKEAFDERQVLTSNGIKQRIDSIGGMRKRARERSEARWQAQKESPPTPPPRNKTKGKEIESKVKRLHRSSAKNSEESQMCVIGDYFRCTEEEKATFLAQDGDTVFADRVQLINDYCANKGPYKNYAAAYRNFKRNAAKFDGPVNGNGHRGKGRPMTKAEMFAWAEAEDAKDEARKKLEGETA